MKQTNSSDVERLLDREVPAGYRGEWTQIVSSENSVAQAATKSIVVFRIGCEWLALPTVAFQEVTEECRIHTLPHRNNGVLRGIVNVRGEILLCVALNVLLGIESSRGRAGQAAHELRGRILVCDRNGDRMAFVVDEVYGVHRYQPTELKQLPATAAKSASTYALGLVPWKSNQAIACLDDELVFYALNKGLV